MKYLIMIIGLVLASNCMASDVVILSQEIIRAKEEYLGHLTVAIDTATSTLKFTVAGLATAGIFIFGFVFKLISDNKKQQVNMLAELNTEKQARVETCAVVERSLVSFKLDVEREYVRTEAISHLLEVRIKPLEKKIDQLVKALTTRL